MYIRTSQKRADGRKANAELVALALAQNWPVGADVREEVVNEMMAIVKDESLPAQLRALAAKNLLLASKLNLDAIKLAAVAGDPHDSKAAEPEDINPYLKTLRDAGALNGRPIS